MSPRIVFQFFRPDTVLVNFCFDIAIRGTGSAIAIGQEHRDAADE